MNETTPTPDPLGKWAPYFRWLLLVAILVLGPKIGLTPGQIPPLPTPNAQQINTIEAAVQRIERTQDEQSKTMKALAQQQ